MEKTMKSLINIANNEDGSVVVIALIILVFLTIIGIAATTTTNIELQVAGNEKLHKIAFYRADSGVYVTPKLISACIDSGAEVTIGSGTTEPDMRYATGSSSTLFYGQIMGYDTYDGGIKDIEFTLSGFDVGADVRRDRVENLAGGGVEFGSGAEGIGAGSGGGVAIFYEMDSYGHGPANSISIVSAVYRKVVGVPGGL
jgi:hypothetical protein